MEPKPIFSLFSTKLILWDQSPADKDVVVAFDGESLHTFIIDMDNVAGPAVTYLGTVCFIIPY